MKRKKVIGIIISTIVLLGIAWFTRNQIEYTRWWNRLPPNHELKHINDTNVNPILAFIRRGLNWSGAEGLKELQAFHTTTKKQATEEPMEEAETVEEQEKKVSMADFRKNQGPPDRSEVINGETWYFYGTSYIRFDQAGNMTHAYNAGDLKGIPVEEVDRTTHVYRDYRPKKTEESAW